MKKRIITFAILGAIAIIPTLIPNDANASVTGSSKASQFLTKTELSAWKTKVDKQIETTFSRTTMLEKIDIAMAKAISAIAR